MRAKVLMILPLLLAGATAMPVLADEKIPVPTPRPAYQPSEVAVQSAVTSTTVTVLDDPRTVQEAFYSPEQQYGYQGKPATAQALKARKPVAKKAVVDPVKFRTGDQPKFRRFDFPLKLPNGMFD